MKLINIRDIFQKNTDAITYAFIMNMLMFIPSLLTPIYKMIFTDYIFIDHKTDWLVLLMVLMGLTAVFSGVVNKLQRNCLSRLSDKIEISGLNKYMRIMFNSSIRLFLKKDSYSLVSQSRKSGYISRLLTEDILSLLFDTFRVVFYLFLMMRIDITMSLIVIALVAANFILGKLTDFLRDKFSNDEKDVHTPEELTARDERLCALGLQNIETFKSTTSEMLLFKRLLGTKTAVINSKKSDDFEEACSPFESLPEVFFLNILLMISALRIMDRTFSIGTYLEFQAYASAFFYPLSGVLSIYTQLKKFEKSLTRYFRKLGSNDEEKITERNMTADGKIKLEGFIEFKNVSFSYEKDAPVIKDFNLTVKPGQKIALLGKAGTGKTTLLKLLQGLYEPDSGEVLIDGIPSAKIEKELFKNSIGSANQEIAVFSASIRENITMWDDSLTEMDIYFTAKDACLHGFVSSLDGAYDHQLTENGNNLSKGQHQRIEIARALVYNPSVVLFDEATSSIEPANRKSIEENLDRRGCTCIAATHLLSEITKYDEIIILGKAEIITRGTHDELLESSSYYRSLFEMEGLTENI